MFKLSPKLSSPFGILGDDAKLSFRTQPGGIRRLAESRNISTTDTYWEQYVTLFDSPSDAFSLISSNDIRRALTDAPENVATLVRFLSSRLFILLVDDTFPTPLSTGVSSFAPPFIRNAATSSGASTPRDLTKEVLNCLRVLQRVFPVLFEAEFEEFEKRLLWEREEVQEDGSGGRMNTLDERLQFVIDDEEDDDDVSSSGPSRSPLSAGETNKSTETAGTSRNGKKVLPALAERLMSCTMDLLFCCGFTLPSKIQVDGHKINYVIWEKGVGSTIDPGPNQAHDQSKVEVLRFSLVLLSKQIYFPPASHLSVPSPYSLFFVQRTPRRHVLAILCSLLNTAMNSASSSTSVAANLPYNHLVFKGEDVRLTLTGETLQVLCALLDFQSGSARDVLAVPNDPSSSAPSIKTNAFRYFLAKLHRQADFAFIVDGIIGILRQYMAAINNVLPGSRKPIPHLLETIIFFWKMIELNKKFRTYILESEKAVDVMAYLLCYFMESKDKPEQHGLCRAISYILQSLSAEPTFNAKLASPIRITLPSKWASQGTAGDFMINSIYSVVATTSGALNSLYPALIIALSNSAPYFKYLSVTSSNRLVSLFNAFANPSFLLADEGHPRLLFFLLEVFNGVIFNHLNENPNLIYAILRSHKSFEDLGTFTLARGLREIQRMQLAKEEQARRQTGRKSGKADQEAPELEKARLLSTESRDAIGLSAEVDLESRMPRDRPRPIRSGSTAPPSLEQNAEQNAAEQPPLSVSTSDSPQLKSEKARGKMRDRQRSESLDVSDSLERIASAGIGKNVFVPTQDWVASWHRGLPLDTVLLMISELLPKVQNLQSSISSANSTSAIIDCLRSASIRDALPETPSPPCRKFLWSDSSMVWLASLVWGEIYVRGMTPLGIWNATNVRLFHVKHTQSQTRQISEAVSHVVGGLLGRAGSSDSLASRGRNSR